MPLVKQNLELQLIKYFNDNKKESRTSEQMAKDLANIIHNYIKSAMITINGTGTGASPTGPVVTTVTGTGKII